MVGNGPSGARNLADRLNVSPSALWLALSTFAAVLAGSALLVWIAASIAGGPKWYEVALLILFFIAIIWVAPKAIMEWRIRSHRMSDNQRLDAEIGVRGMVITAVTGFGTLYGLLFAAYQLADIEIGRQGFVANQYSEALRNLSTPGLERDGLLAIEEIATESRDYYWRGMNTLADFVRRNAAWKDGTASPRSSAAEVSPEIQEALRILGSRRWEWDQGSPLNLSSTDLRHADLSRAHLGNVDLSEAHLEGANLLAADLRGATVDGADFALAGLVAVDLRRMVLFDVDFGGAILLGARLQGADLTRSFGLSQTQIDEACADAQTLLPDGSDGLPLRANLANLEAPICTS